MVDLKDKNVLILAARGNTGCGDVREAIEIEEYLKSIGCYVTCIFGKDKNWGRDKAQPNDFIQHKFKEAVWNSEEHFDLCIITSVPPKNIDKNEEVANTIYDNFLTTLSCLETNNTKIVYLQCDNKINSITRNFYALSEDLMIRFFSKLDRIIVHNMNADFVTRFIDKKLKPLDYDFKFSLTNQSLISCDFDEVKRQLDEVDISNGQKSGKTCWFIGRSAQWKGWREFRDFHWSILKDAGYVSVIEGIEMSINAKQDLSKDLLETGGRYVWREDALVDAAGQAPLLEDVVNDPDSYRNLPIMIYGPYNRLDALLRMRLAEFGMFFTFTGREFGGQIEITFLEIVASGTVPVIRKELWDNASFNDVWLHELGTPEELGIIVYDSNHKEDCLTLMNKLHDDKELYNKYVENSLKFCKSQFDRSYINNRLITKCLEQGEPYIRKDTGLWF